MKRIVRIAEAVERSVVDIGGRMNVPTSQLSLPQLDKLHCRAGRGRAHALRSLIPGTVNTITTRHHDIAGCPTAMSKLSHISLGDTLAESDDQYIHRFLPVALAISGDRRQHCRIDPSVTSARGTSPRAAIA